MQVLTLAAANKCVEHAIAKTASEFKRPICVAVCDPYGYLVAFSRMDGALRKHQITPDRHLLGALG